MENDLKNRKRFFCRLTLALFCLALLAGCGRSDSELIYEFCDTIERCGEPIDILIGHDQESVSTYYDDDECNLLDKAALPTQELHGTDWEIIWVDTSDFTGDSNSDLRVRLYHADMSEPYIV